MATEGGRPGEDEEEEEDPRITSFKRQLFACSSTYISAITAGFLSQRLHLNDDYYINLLHYSRNFINFFPVVGEGLGIFIATISLHVLGRKTSLIASQTLFLIVLGTHEFYTLTLRLPDPSGLSQEYFCTVAEHMCVRICVIVMTVYITEVTQPGLRAFFLGSFFIPFIISIFLARNLFKGNHLLNATILVQLFAAGFAVVSPETPYWLALKGRLLECEENFFHLRADLSDEIEFEEMLDGAEEDAERRRFLQLASPKFGIPLMKVLFMHAATDGVCQVFLSKNKMPFEFFRYDIYYDHLQYVTGLLPQFIRGVLPDFVQYFWPITGSILFLYVNLVISRRQLFLGTVFATYIIYIFRFSAFMTDKLYLSWIYDSVCYLIGHMGGRQMLLLIPAEIFAAPVKEFGIGASEFIQLIFQTSDYINLEYIPKYYPYNLVRLTTVAFGLSLTYLYMPETKNLTLVETQKLGAQLNHPVLHVNYITDEDEGDLLRPN